MLLSKKPSDYKKLSNGNKKLPPKDDEIEISLFGPSYGESILVHLGMNYWIIVDSCIDPISGFPSPLKYLREIKVNPRNSVKLIIATHWHDDHIRGLSKIVKECEEAEFICSAAQTRKEFFTLVRAYQTRPPMEITGVNEFSEILDVLEKKARNCRSRLLRLKYAFADRILWRHQFELSGFSLSCEIFSLSPSDHSFTLAQVGIASLIPKEGETKRRVPSLKPNYSAVVLLIKIGKDGILLGSDLEDTGDEGTGWVAIINSNTRPQEKASFFKIPHHGSETADNPSIWTSLLKPEPVSSLTPFVLGNVILPRKTDVIRICNCTNEAFSTGEPKQLKSKFFHKIVQKQIKEMGVRIKPVYCSPGQIRARGRFFNNELKWTVELFNGAKRLKELYM